MPRKFSRSIKKYIRKQKSILRQQYPDSEQYRVAVKNLYSQLTS